MIQHLGNLGGARPSKFGGGQSRDIFRGGPVKKSPCSKPPKNCMQNSEAVQAWFQGKMASFRILSLVSKNEIRSREFSFSSRNLRVKIINLDLVSMPEIGGNFFLGLVSKPESKCQEFSVSSRWTRLNRKNSHSRLEIEKTTLADHWSGMMWRNHFLAYRS